MEGVSSIKLFPPSWREIESLDYVIQHKDTFRINKTVREPLISEYPLKITSIAPVEGWVILEAELAYGIWPAIQHRQGLGELRKYAELLADKTPVSFQFATHDTGEYGGLTDPEEIETAFSAWGDRVLGVTPKEDVDDIKRLIESVAEDICEWATDDLEQIFLFVGSEMPEPSTEVSPLTKGKALIKYDYLEDSYKIDILRGRNLESSNLSHRFDLLFKNYLAGELNLDDYPDLAISRNQFWIDNKLNLLKEFTKDVRITSRIMSKKLTMKIDLINVITREFSSNADTSLIVDNA